VQFRVVARQTLAERQLGAERDMYGMRFAAATHTERLHQRADARGLVVIG
jgi:hypothetical protein